MWVQQLFSLFNSVFGLYQLLKAWQLNNEPKLTLKASWSRGSLLRVMPLTLHIVTWYIVIIKLSIITTFSIVKNRFLYLHVVYLEHDWACKHGVYRSPCVCENVSVSVCYCHISWKRVNFLYCPLKGRKKTVSHLANSLDPIIIVGNYFNVLIVEWERGRPWSLLTGSLWKASVGGSHCSMLSFPGALINYSITTSYSHCSKSFP